MHARRTLVVVTGLALALSAGGAGASQPARPAPDGGARPDERVARVLEQLAGDGVVLRGSPTDPRLRPARATLPDALAGLRRRPEGFDLRALGTLSRAAIRTFSGVTIAEPAAALSDANQPIHFGTAASDLDGDGHADVFDYVSFPDGSAELVARDGTDGAAMWSVPLDGVDAFAFSLPGEVGATVVLMQLYAGDGFAEGGCELFGTQGCFAAEGGSFVWTLDALDGGSGASRWSRRLEGTIAAADTYQPLDPAATFDTFIVGTNVMMLPLAAGDHDGDGRADLVLNEFDLAGPQVGGDLWTEEAGALVFAEGFVTTTRATLTAAGDGAVLYARAIAGPGISVLTPTVDGVGDTTPDLLWDQLLEAGPMTGCVFGAGVGPDEACTQVFRQKHDIEMIDGASLTTAWTADLGAPGWVLPAGGDLSGDGREDLNFIKIGEYGLQTVALSSADGSTLWATDAIMLGPVGSVDDTPLALAIEIAFDDTDLIYRFVRLRGSDGSHFSSTEHRVALPTDSFDLFILAEFDLVPDLDGDGHRDAFAQITIFANDTTVDLTLERGNTGALVFQRHVDGERFGVVLGDLSGDGKADVLDLLPIYHRRSFVLELSSLTMPGGATAWMVPVVTSADAFIVLDVNGDMSGAGGDDLLVSAAQRTEADVIESQLDAIEGTDGSSAWHVGGPLSPPPPVAPGGIAGTITGDGASFPGACLAVVDLDHNDVAFTVARSDGTYLVPELEDGSYLVRFGDCFFGTYAEEWYDDVPSPELATPVVVAGGITTGIDADLAPAF